MMENIAWKRNILTKITRQALADVSTNFRAVALDAATAAIPENRPAHCLQALRHRGA